MRVRGLRKPEGDKYERFFALVQKEALKKGCVFFADCAEGNNFENEFMEGENTSGWLIPLEKADEFEREFKNNWDGPEGWDEFFCWAEWEDEENPKISFVWYY